MWREPTILIVQEERCMDNSLLTGIFTIAGAVIGAAATSLVSIYTIKHNDITQNQKNRIREMLTSLAGFHELEEVYIQKLIEARVKNGEKTFVTHDAIVKETRKVLREENIAFDFQPRDINLYKKIFSMNN